MRFSVLLIFAFTCCAQPPLANPNQEQPNREQNDLQQAVNEASNSPIDLTRSLEAFLKKYPNATQMKEIERALAKAAIDNKDDRRTVQYGERVLASTPDDMLVLDRVARAEIALGGKENVEKALAHAHRFQEIVEKLPEASGLGAAKMREERDRGVAR